MNPKISVIMPAYNAGKYIKDAIDSVVNQSFKDWELLVVNDASKDNTLEIIKSFTDPRIKLTNNEINLGSILSRNLAFEKSKGEYIAILDADDIAFPNRFSEQVKFLDSHPDFGLVASYTKIIDENGVPTGQIGKDNTRPEEAPIKLLFHNFLAFSSVMMRKKAMPEVPFTVGSVPVEDVDLYWKMIYQWKFYTLPKILICYRSHGKGISKVLNTEKQKVMDSLIRNELKKFDLNPSEEELKIHRNNFGHGGSELESFLRERELWLLKLCEKNSDKKIHPENLFNRVVAEKWFDSCNSNTRLGLKIWKIYNSSPLSRNLGGFKNAPKLIKFGLKCLISKDKIRS